MFGMVIETGPKFCMVLLPNPVHDDQVCQGHRLRILYKSVMNCFFTISFFFAKPSMDFIHLWRDDRVLSKILRSTFPITDFEFFVLNFYSVSFCKDLY